MTPVHPRVLFFVFGFPPDFSGATLQTIELARALRRRGVLSSFLAETYDRALPAVSAHDGFLVRRIVRRGDRSVHRFGAALARAIAARAGEFDVLWFGGNPGEFWTTAWATLAARLLGKRVLVELNMEFYDGDPLRIRGTRFETAKAGVARLVECYLPNSPAVLRGFPADLVGPRAELLPYGVDLERFRPAHSRDEVVRWREALALPLDRKVVCAVGAVTRRKNTDFVLRAWRRICDRSTSPPLLVWLGPLMTEDRECHDASWVRAVLDDSRSGALAGNVRFPGHIERPELYLRAADAFVFASRQEGSPSVVREALASGLPVVALELPGITDELVRPGENGYLVRPQDREAFRAWQEGPFAEERALEELTLHLVSVLHDPSLARSLSRAARSDAVARFSIEARAARVLELVSGQARAEEPRTSESARSLAAEVGS